MSDLEEEEKSPTFLSSYTTSLLKYFTSMLVLIINFIALSISLNCNKDRNILVRIILAFLAFTFSLPYLFIHFVRIVIFNKEKCTFNNIQFFN